MDDQIPMTDDYVPEFQLEDTPTVTETQPAVMPEYITRSDLEAFAETIASKLQPQQQAVTQPTQDWETTYEEVAYSDPRKAARMLVDKAKQELMQEIAPNFAPIVQDYYGRSATSGMAPAEAEYIQQQVAKGTINPAALKDPGVMEIVTMAAKQYAAQKAATTPVPSAESGVGGGFNLRSPQAQAQKQMFERFFPGLKYEDAVKQTEGY